jgi:signal transduction histidine kinase
MLGSYNEEGPSVDKDLAAKMAAIGELAAYVAQDTDIPFTSVLGYTSHLLTSLEITEEYRQTLGVME